MTEDVSTERLLGRVEQAIIDLDNTMKRIGEELQSQGHRITKLEHKATWVSGVAYVGAAVGGWFAAHIHWLS